MRLRVSGEHALLASGLDAQPGDLARLEVKQLRAPGLGRVLGLVAPAPPQRHTDEETGAHQQHRQGQERASGLGHRELAVTWRGG